MERKGRLLQIDDEKRVFRHFKLVEPLIATVLLVCKQESNFTVGFERYDKLFGKVEFDKTHIVSRSKPDIIEYISKRNLVPDALL